VSGFRGFVLTIRFLCELGLLVALAYWGFETQEGAAAIALGVGAPLVAIALWGSFVAPKALVPVPIQSRLIVEFTLWGLGALALADAGQAVLGLALGAVGVGTSLLNASQERDAARPG
jgi:hypothetical protein